MKKLNIPSLQHLARHWQDTPEGVCDQLVNFAKHPPTFSYQILFALARDLVVLHQPLEDIIEAVNRKIAREDVRENFLAILPLIQQYFEKARPAFIQSVNGRMYPLGRNLLIPFSPPLVYGANGNLVFPWFSFWKTNPLSGERLSLFVTVVDEILKQDADLENAIFQILDFSAPAGSKTRALVVTDSKDVPRLSQSRKEEMLAIFADGFQLAQLALVKEAATGRNQTATNQRDDGQMDLFDR